MTFIKNAGEYSSHFFDAGNGLDPFPELVALAREIVPGADIDILREIHYDIVDLFTGKNVQFKRNTMPYHTLRHTMMVTLAAMRFFHGLSCQKRVISWSTLLRGMLCAYFHDTGMLIKTEDPNDNPSLYITVHEQRSALFLSEYIKTKRFPPELAEDADVIIAYTWLRQNPADLRPHSSIAQMLGQVVGAADLLAQMGDRYYLESLPLLFEEFRRGGINAHENVLELMAHTVSFFHGVVLKRLTITYHDVLGAMQTHFLVQQRIKKNLYMEGIEKNLRYLNEINEECDDLACVRAHLRRKIPILE